MKVWKRESEIKRKGVERKKGISEDNRTKETTKINCY
jgi:hypothetical protein